MQGKQLVFGRIAREATGGDGNKMNRIAQLLNPGSNERKMLERNFPKTCRILESLALAEMKVSGVEGRGMSPSLRLQAKAELGSAFEELERALAEEASGTRKNEKRLRFLEEACKYGALCGVGLPVSSLFVFSFFNIQPTAMEFATLGISGLAGLAMAYAAHKLEKARAAKHKFEETVEMLVAHVRSFLDKGMAEFADDE